MPPCNLEGADWRAVGKIGQIRFVTCDKLHLAIGVGMRYDACMNKLMLSLIPAIALAFPACDQNAETPKTAMIGSSPVTSDIQCEEDELIGYIQKGDTPYELGCIHSESFNGYN